MLPSHGMHAHGWLSLTNTTLGRGGLSLRWLAARGEETVQGRCPDSRAAVGGVPLVALICC